MILSKKLCAGIFSIVLALGLVSGFAQAADSETDPNFNRARERAAMMAHLENPPVQALSIVNIPRDPEAATFLNFFKTTLWPDFEKMGLYVFRRELLHTATDRALYNDASEEDQWRKMELEASQIIDALDTNPKRQENIRIWAKQAKALLAKGLKGELIDLALRMEGDLDASSFTEKELPLLNRQSKIELAISEIANKSPLANGLDANEKAINDTIEAYFAKKISFQEAWKKLESLQPASRTAHGQDIAIKGRKLFKELAVIRTKLAQSKGYRTWAEYRIASQARQLKAPFNSVNGLVEFLTKILTDTLPIYHELLRKQFAATEGAKLSKARSSQLSLVALEEDTLIRDYLPKEGIEAAWRKTMLESGFDPEILKNLILDGYPRPKKYTHAYMNNVSNRAPKVLVIDGTTFSHVPGEVNSQTWFDALIYVVQNYRDNGTDAWSTMWHEGGHFLDYAHQQDIYGQGASNANAETHSMTMERFFLDIEFLLANGKTKTGEALPKELAEQYILNARINSMSSLRIQVSQALYDIMLWHREYTENGDDFVTVAKELRRKYQTEATQVRMRTVNGIDPSYRGFSTNHFYGGLVRYFGYILAEVAAQMNAEFLWEKFEKETGRRSLYKQPELARLLIEGYYKNGFLKPFPQPVEDFTGKPFSSDVVIGNAIKASKLYTPCTKPMESIVK